MGVLCGNSGLVVGVAVTLGVGSGAVTVSGAGVADGSSGSVVPGMVVEWGDSAFVVGVAVTPGVGSGVVTVSRGAVTGGS